MLRHAQDTLRDEERVVRALNGTDLHGIADQSVDVAYCSGVFMHLDEWDRYRYVVEPPRAEAGRAPLDRQFQSAERGEDGRCSRISITSNRPPGRRTSAAPRRPRSC